MNGDLGHDSAMTNAKWANEVNFVQNHASGAGLIAQPVDQQSSDLQLYNRCTHKVNDM